ncbi:PREDICTED: kallikrein 1-related peptidase b5-like [Ceratosolen solmsi marchali]|uniref:Kallikrein 1-related peptidase b5-like n=1 Tax=Ceratosolen solmsi marchali TaxID=326594 RepID=A0AAJ7DV06_9HYME|nr:PREDICTED: kallikrein 1-related peptidase b5-like [Ceratosolen solmsi marchali]
MSGRTKLNYNLVMTGWGHVGRGILPETSDILCTVNEPKVPIRTCQESIRQAFNWVELNDLQICTRPLDGSDLACMGDFGGPLIQYDSNNKPEIIGIRTWTMIACNTNGVPPIYARIPSFVKWINKNINQN